MVRVWLLDLKTSIEYKLRFYKKKKRFRMHRGREIVNYGPADKIRIFISAISRGLRFSAFSLTGTYFAPDQEQNMNIRFSSSHTITELTGGGGGGVWGGGGGSSYRLGVQISFWYRSGC